MGTWLGFLCFPSPGISYLEGDRVLHMQLCETTAPFSERGCFTASLTPARNPALQHNIHRSKVETPVTTLG